MRYLFIHGNPGCAEELVPLAEALGVKDLATFHDRPRRGTSFTKLLGSLDRAAPQDEPYTAVGYSFGAYLALEQVRFGFRKPARLVLVSPYIVAEKPISAVAAFLTSLPGLSGLLLGPAKRAPEFVKNCLAPGSAPDATVDWLTKGVSDLEAWQGAVAYKRLMQRQPIYKVEGLPCPTLLVRGADDLVCTWETQLKPLAGVMGSLKDVVLPRAGHGLPFTHAQAVAEAVRAFEKA